MGVHTNQARRGRRSATLVAVVGLLAALLVPAVSVGQAGAAEPGAGSAPAAAPKGPKVSEEAAAAVADGAEAFVIANLAAPANAPQAIESTAQAVIDGLPEGSYQGEARAQAVPFVALKVDAAGLDALEADPGVTSVVINHRNVQSLVNSVPAVGGDVARNQGYDGAGTAVAVLDVGVQADHPFLSDGRGNSRVVAEGCFSGLGNVYVNIYSLCPSGDATQTGPGSAAPCPIAAASGCGHGTHVSGIAAGGLATNNGSSQPKWGVAPKASVLAANVFSLFCEAQPDVNLNCPTANGWLLSAFDSDIALAMNWVDGLRSTYNVAAVNLSVGSTSTYAGTCDGGTLLTSNINTLKSHGIASVVASGNGSAKNGISSPACVSTAVSVGSWDDGTNTVSGFSNSSSQLTLLAPGARNNGGIVSAYPTSTYASVKGTSMAAPHVAGAMALLHQLKPGNTVDQNVALLTSTGVGVTDSGNGITKPLIRLAQAMASVATVPGAPQGVTAGGGDGQVAVSWQAALSGGSPVTSYVATLQPGGLTCTWTIGPLGCTVSGLTNGVTYTATVHAHNAIGDGPESAAASTAPSVPYVPIVPTRYFESRTPAQGGGGTFDGAYAGAGSLPAGTPVPVEIAGRGSVPADAVAVALNVTVTGSSGGGYLTVYPEGVAAPLASNLNFGPGQVVANMVVTKVGTDGKIDLRAIGGNTPVIVDVVGYYPPGTSYTPIVPKRYLETRSPAQGGGGTWDGVSNAQGPIANGGTRDVQIAGRTFNSETPVPANATAVALNVTVATSTGGGYMTVYPKGVTAPLASNLNYYPSQTVPNMVVSKVGTGGSITIKNVGGSTDVIVDVVGYFAPGQGYTPLVPARLMETRSPAQGGAATVDGLAWNEGSIGNGATRALTVAGRGGVPAYGVSAVALNVTVAGSTGGGYLTVYPSGVTMPLASNVNFYPGQVIPNMVIAKVGADGKIAIANFGGITPVVVDVVGWFP